MSHDELKMAVFSEEPVSAATESGPRVALGREPQTSEAILAPPDVTALALSARGRDLRAVRAFLQAIAPAVRGVCRSVLGGAHVDLDDTVQECLLDIVRALPHYRAEGPALHYAKRIALRAAITARTRSRSRERRLRAIAAETSVHNASGGGTELHLDLVRQVLEALPAVQAEAILMRSILGFSIEEIARVTAVSNNTAKSRLRVAKETLRLRLEREHSAAESDHER